MMLPIPYASRCKVTWEEQSSGKRYYQINYRRYPSGTRVQTFTAEILNAARPALSAVARQLLAPPTSPAGEVASTTFSLAPDKEKIIDLPSGENALRFLKFLLSSNGGDATDHALRSLVVKMTFDGEQTVWCPVSDFFGSAVGVNVMANWYNTVQADGTMIGRWVMPYQHSGRITLHNYGPATVGGTLEHHTAPWNWDNRSMHFHTAWNYEAGMRTPPIADWKFVSLEGKGVYIGDTLALYNEAATWYGEGDEKIRVDGEAFPSHFGTGTEDYYNYSFAPRMNMQTPWANLTRVDQAATQGHNVMSRSRNLDGIPFTKSLDFDIELISWVPTRLMYAATSRWYAFPGGKTNVEPDPPTPLPTSQPSTMRSSRVRFSRCAGRRAGHRRRNIGRFRSRDAKHAGLWLRRLEPGRAIARTRHEGRRLYHAKHSGTRQCSARNPRRAHAGRGFRTAFLHGEWPGIRRDLRRLLDQRAPRGRSLTRHLHSGGWKIRNPHPGIGRESCLHGEPILLRDRLFPTPLTVDVKHQ